MKKYGRGALSSFVVRASNFELRTSSSFERACGHNGGVKRFVLLLLLVGACTNERPLPAVSSSDDLKKPQEGGTVIRRLQGAIATLNPIMSQIVNDRQVHFYLLTPAG